MKVIPSALGTHYATRNTTMADALKIIRPDGTIYAFTSHDIDDEISGIDYLANPGLSVSDIVIAANAAVGNLELTTLHDGAVFTSADVLGGRWKNSAFVLFRYNWASIADGIDIQLAGTFGEVELKQNQVVVELRDYRQYLQQPVGNVSQKTCPWRLGSTSRFQGGLCMKDISAAPWTMPFTVTSVTSNQVFRDSARAEAADFFGEGSIIWLTGNNAGISQKVKEYAANGTFTLALPMYATVQVGDTGTAVVGCRKRRDEDCVTKFNNVLNFGGQPDRRGLNNVTQSVT